jgi:hypothetical protein
MITVAEGYADRAPAEVYAGFADPHDEPHALDDLRGLLRIIGIDGTKK